MSELEEIEREDNFRLKRFKELKIKKSKGNEDNTQPQYKCSCGEMSDMKKSIDVDKCMKCMYESDINSIEEEEQEQITPSETETIKEDFKCVGLTDSCSICKKSIESDKFVTSQKQLISNNLDQDHCPICKKYAINEINNIKDAEKQVCQICSDSKIKSDSQSLTISNENNGTCLECKDADIEKVKSIKFIDPEASNITPVVDLCPTCNINDFKQVKNIEYIDQRDIVLSGKEKDLVREKVCPICQDNKGNIDVRDKSCNKISSGINIPCKCAKKIEIIDQREEEQVESYLNMNHKDKGKIIYEENVPLNKIVCPSCSDTMHTCNDKKSDQTVSVSNSKNIYKIQSVQKHTALIDSPNLKENNFENISCSSSCTSKKLFPRSLDSKENDNEKIGEIVKTYKEVVKIKTLPGINGIIHEKKQIITTKTKRKISPCRSENKIIFKEKRACKTEEQVQLDNKPQNDRPGILKLTGSASSAAPVNSDKNKSPQNLSKANSSDVLSLISQSVSVICIDDKHVRATKSDTDKCSKTNESKIELTPSTIIILKDILLQLGTSASCKSVTKTDQNKNQKFKHDKFTCIEQVCSCNSISSQTKTEGKKLESKSLYEKFGDFLSEIISFKSKESETTSASKHSNATTVKSSCTCASNKSQIYFPQSESRSNKSNSNMAKGSIKQKFRSSNLKRAVPTCKVYICKKQSSNNNNNKSEANKTKTEGCRCQSSVEIDGDHAIVSENEQTSSYCICKISQSDPKPEPYCNIPMQESKINNNCRCKKETSCNLSAVSKSIDTAKMVSQESSCQTPNTVVNNVKEINTDKTEYEGSQCACRKSDTKHADSLSITPQSSCKCKPLQANEKSECPCSKTESLTKHNNCQQKRISEKICRCNFNDQIPLKNQQDSRNCSCSKPKSNIETDLFKCTHNKRLSSETNKDMCLYYKNNSNQKDLKNDSSQCICKASKSKATSKIEQPIKQCTCLKTKDSIDKETKCCKCNEDDERMACKASEVKESEISSEKHILDKCPVQCSIPSVNSDNCSDLQTMAVASQTYSMMHDVDTQSEVEKNISTYSNNKSTSNCVSTATKECVCSNSKLPSSNQNKIEEISNLCTDNDENDQGPESCSCKISEKSICTGTCENNIDRSISDTCCKCGLSYKTGQAPCTCQSGISNESKQECKCAETKSKICGSQGKFSRRPSEYSMNLSTCNENVETTSLVSRACSACISGEAIKSENKLERGSRTCVCHKSQYNCKSEDTLQKTGSKCACRETKSMSIVKNDCKCIVTRIHLPSNCTCLNAKDKISSNNFNYNIDKNKLSNCTCDKLKAESTCKTSNIESQSSKMCSCKLPNQTLPDNYGCKCKKENNRSCHSLDSKKSKQILSQCPCKISANRNDSRSSIKASKSTSTASQTCTRCSSAQSRKSLRFSNVSSLRNSKPTSPVSSKCSICSMPIKNSSSIYNTPCTKSQSRCSVSSQISCGKRDASTSTRRTERFDVRTLKLLNETKKLTCPCHSDSSMLKRPPKTKSISRCCSLQYTKTCCQNFT